MYIIYKYIIVYIRTHIKKKCCMVFLNHFFIRWTLKTNKKGCAHTHNWVNKTFQSEWESPVILTTKNGVTDHFGQITFCCHQLCVKNTFLSTQLFDLNRISREKIGSKPSCYRRGKKYYTTSPSLNMTI